MKEDWREKRICSPDSSADDTALALVKVSKLKLNLEKRLEVARMFYTLVKYSTLHFVLLTK